MATGKGRRITGGVDGVRFISGEDNGESDVDEESELCSVTVSGGKFDAAGGRAGLVGRDAPGDGGGRTKEVGRSELVRGANDFIVEKYGAVIGGMSSVSYENIAFEGEARERIETQ